MSSYSKKQLVEKYSSFAESYSKVIVELKEFMNRPYAKNNMILLTFHCQFCYKAIGILNEVIDDIKNSNMSEFICKSLEELIKSCDKEHKDLEDTYKRFPYEKTSDYYKYEEIHRKLRENCDEMAYLDETIPFLRSMIEKKAVVNTFTNNFSGSVDNLNLQQGTVNSTQTQNINSGFDYEIVSNIVSEIRKSDRMIDDAFGERANDLREKLNQIEELIQKQESPRLIKSLLGDVKNLALGVTGSLIATGIVALIP